LEHRGRTLCVAEEIGNHFRIAGAKPGAKVSWQATGVRQDTYAKAHWINVEEDMPGEQKGYYLHPELFWGHGKGSRRGDQSTGIGFAARSG
jgi:hypothetical protein